MGEIRALEGNAAIAYGVMLAKVQLIAAYPITPQTPIVEQLSSWIGKGEFDATYINVESEHSAMSAVAGAAAAGIRTFTASASHGLALMHEMTGVVAGTRLPVVMAVVSRALPAPCNLQCDHSDIMGERDQGWIQLFACDPQEALDFTMIAYKISEDERVLLPVMVDIDGFYVSHLTEPVDVPSEGEAGRFIRRYKPVNYQLDFEQPLAINNLLSPDVYAEVKRGQNIDMANSGRVIDECFREFEQIFGRKHERIRSYFAEDAETVFVCMGSITGAILTGVEHLREQGENVGLIRVVTYRPFPNKDILYTARNAKIIAVIDRCHDMGSWPPLYLDVVASANNCCRQMKTYSFTAGLGGRNVSEKVLKQAYEKIMACEREGSILGASYWLDIQGEQE